MGGGDTIRPCRNRRLRVNNTSKTRYFLSKSFLPPGGKPFDVFINLQNNKKNEKIQSHGIPGHAPAAPVQAMAGRRKRMPLSMSLPRNSTAIALGKKI
jgi:hypothetical protein